MANAARPTPRVSMRVWSTSHSTRISPVPFRANGMRSVTSGLTVACMARAPRSNDHIGVRVRRERERSGKSQAVVAGLAGISEDYLGQIERGRKTPSTSVVQALADALHVSAGALLGDVSTNTAHSPTLGGDRLALALLSGRSSLQRVASHLARIDSGHRSDVAEAPSRPRPSPSRRGCQ
ncbi:helix-turn-helix domain-containing protein [Nocardia sp. CDC153]|uniref:helix-turn-helix domain-containing protein n=1 Tax=Nocardia sp. CDC153 TaxID=3112167 RepID=UPI002DBD3586|nr:helix-turn-helix domain-containing protein [Nocardia sp. CDC153]MEC3953626.1 helix-turn-helix domain-containing protein [Nocardia sp. CDC153]